MSRLVENLIAWAQADCVVLDACVEQMRSLLAEAAARIRDLEAQQTAGEPEVIAILREHRPLRFEFREEILAAYDAMKAERDAAVRERDAMRVTAAKDMPVAVKNIGEIIAENHALRTRAERMERVVEAAKAYEKWMGKWHDYTKTTGDVPHKVEAALINAVRAAVAAETTTNTEDTIV